MSACECEIEIDDNPPGRTRVECQCDHCPAVYVRFEYASTKFPDYRRCAACASKAWVRETVRRARLLH